MTRARMAVPWSLVALAALSFANTRGTGQTQHPAQQFAQPSTTSTSDLPDSPGTVLSNHETANSVAEADAPELSVRNIESSSVLLPARRFHRVVRPFEEAPPLSAGGKLELSVMSRFTPAEAFATTFGAGWSQWRNSRPHTGTDSGAFGERLRDIAIKQTSQSFFGYGVYAAAFHQDPRFYVLGPTVPVARRAVYAGTRTIITKNDDGKQTANWSKLAGIATATALTEFYYPKVDRGFGNQSKAFATSIGTSMLNDELHEFIGDALHLIHRNQ